MRYVVKRDDVYRVSPRGRVWRLVRWCCTGSPWEPIKGALAFEIRNTPSAAPISRARLMRYLRRLSACRAARGRVRKMQGPASKIWNDYTHKADMHWLICVGISEVPRLRDVAYHTRRMETFTGDLINELLVAAGA
jgi:hypothetical protein